MGSPDMINVLVVVTKSSRERNEPWDRGTEYQSLVEETQSAKECLIAWLKDLSVWNEVKEVGEVNAFSIIPFTCSPRVAALLKDAPSVQAVAPADFPIDLIE